MLLNTGAATIPPNCCCPLGSKITTINAISGVSAGTKPTNELMNLSFEYLFVLLSINCAVPVFPATWFPSIAALVAVPPSSTTVLSVSLNIKDVFSETAFFLTPCLKEYTSCPSGFLISDTT